jgi:hypothetical protein
MKTVLKNAEVKVSDAVLSSHTALRRRTKRFVRMFDTSTVAGRRRSLGSIAFFALLAFSIRLGYVAHQYLTDRDKHGGDRATGDLWSVWQMAASAFYMATTLLVVAHLFIDRNADPWSRGSYIVCVACLCVLTYSEQDQLGSTFVMISTPAVATFLGIEFSAIVVCYVFSTAAMLVILLCKDYCQSIFRHRPEYAGWHAALYFAMTSATLVIVPLIVDSNNASKRRRFERCSHFVAEVTELLISVNTVHATALIDREEHRKLNGAATAEVLASMHRLTRALARMRSYLPNSLLVPNDPHFEEDDDDGPSEAVEESVSGDPDASTADLHHRLSASGHRLPSSLQAQAHTSATSPQDDSQPSLTKDNFQERTTFRRRWSTLMHVTVQVDCSDSSAIERTSAKVCEATIPRIVERRGVIESISPQSVLASFNCHAPCVIHETEACHCALAIAAELSQHADLRFCIIVASGYNFVGSCGVQSHRAKVVIGESKELIYTLPSLAGPILGSRIIISEDTANKVGLETAPIDFVLPKRSGRPAGKPITLFELRSSRKDNALSALSSTFSNAFAVFRSGQAQKSLPLWHSYIQRAPMDLQAQRLAAIASLIPDGQPYVRKELQWDVLPQEMEWAARDVKSANFSASGTLTRSAGDSVTVAASVRQHLAAEKLDLQEDGLIPLFLPEDEDDAPKSEVVVEEDEVSTQVPRTFEDAMMGHTWRRSEERIGFGAFSTVYLALSNQGDLIAMKCFNLTKRSTSREELVQEVDTLSRLRYDHIVGYVTYAVTTNHFIILMEYVSGGSLQQILSQFGPLPVPAAKRYLIDILKGLRYLHEHSITHCDIKPHNVLLGNDGTCKLSDFGSSVNSVQSQRLRGGESGNSDDDVLLRGTSWYLSPEAARGMVLPANDIWSVGVTFLEMITGKQPWTFKGTEAQFIVALGKDEAMVPPISGAVPEDAAAFVRLCCNRDAALRPGAEQLLQSPFLT